MVYVAIRATLTALHRQKRRRRKGWEPTVGEHQSRQGKEGGGEWTGGHGKGVEQRNSPSGPMHRYY